MEYDYCLIDDFTKVVLQGAQIAVLSESIENGGASVKVGGEPVMALEI